MKEIYKTTAAILTGALMLGSCSTTSRMAINAPLNTTISNSTHQSLGSYKNGRVEVEVKDDIYYPYLIAKDPATGLNVPFGIDVHRNKYVGEKAAYAGGIVVATVGLGLMLPGTIMVICASDDDEASDIETMGWGFLGGGLAGGLGGAGIISAAQNRLEQTTHQYELAYNKKQAVSFDGLSATLINPDKPKDAPEEAAQTSKRRRAASSGESVNGNTEDGSAAVAKRRRGDHAAKIAGTYAGQGTLYSGSDIDEEYSDVKVVITRIDKTHVAVRVIEGGEDFFATPLEYVVESNGNKGYKLTVEGTPSATITIDNRGSMKFDHKKVNIEGELFSLSVKAKRK